MEDTGQILPTYLRFVKGVIDSSDLPLNVSREILQGSRAVDNMRSTATKRILRRLADLAAEEPEKYTTFWKEFGSTLKEGIPEDFTNRDEIAKLLRFTTTKSASDEPDTSLAQYVERMKDGQEHIYYLLAPSLAAAKSSPHLEAFRAKGVEVLLLGDTVDNWLASGLREFDGKQLQSVAQGAASLSSMADEDEKQAKERADAEYADLAGKLKSHLTGQASDVRLSTRLTSSPACIVSNEPESDMTIAARLRGTGLPRQPILEINPDHPLIQRLNASADDARLREWAQVLFSQSVLTFGARLENPATFVGELNTLLTALTADAPETAAAPETDGSGNSDEGSSDGDPDGGSDSGSGDGPEGGLAADEPAPGDSATASEASSEED
jgi:molecular chaperone HtpG